MTVALITGGSRGFGFEVSAALAARGWEVIIDGRDANVLRAAAARLGHRIHAIPGDVTDTSHRAALVRAARRRGRLDLLLNNASSLGPSPLPRLRDFPLDQLDAVYDTNVLAPLALVQEARALLVASGGAIVNVTSDAAVEPYEGWGGYGSSKAALDQLTSILGVEEPLLHVWSFDPGDMRTQMHQDAFPGEDISDRPEPASVVPALLRLLDERPPSGRVRASDLTTGVGA